MLYFPSAAQAVSPFSGVPIAVPSLLEREALAYCLCCWSKIGRQRAASRDCPRYRLPMPACWESRENVLYTSCNCSRCRGARLKELWET